MPQWPRTPAAPRAQCLGGPSPTAVLLWPSILVASSCCGGAHDESSSGAVGVGPALGQMDRGKNQLLLSRFPLLPWQ